MTNERNSPKALLTGVAAFAMAVTLAADRTAVAADDGGSTAGSSTGHFKYYPPIMTAPSNAPNILVILTDDVGFGASSAFGGPIETPVLEDLAANGLKYNQFHTTAMCSPTRAALLTGRNHHAVATGDITNISVDAPGYTSVIPGTAATVGAVLGASGYATAWFGKNHNTPVWETSPAGPFDRWPNGLGFDYFYGFNEAMTDQFAPQLVENRSLIEPPVGDPGYILEKDLADHAIHWLDMQRATNPTRPFLIYYAPGSAHSPHQAPRDWIARYKGKFDQGWDRMRELTFERQKRLGVIPAGTRLTPRPPQIPSWDSLTPDGRKAASRLMEVYAGMLAYNDHEVGRIVAELRRIGALDNTLVIFIEGDNGASEESFSGTDNDYAALRGVEGDPARTLARGDELGGPRTFGNYPAGWAWAMDTPFQWAKQIASHFGGTRNGMVVSWPARIKDVGGIRSQFHHVIDVAPTIYEAAGVTPPESVRGARQQRIDGVSMVYTFDHPDAPSTHREQYFELLGNRALYLDGWIASTTPERMPWSHDAGAPDPNKLSWELYDVRHDFSQSRNLAAQYPDKLLALKQEFDRVGTPNGVFPLRSDLMGMLAPGNRPSLAAGRSSFAFVPGWIRYPTSALPPLGKGFDVEARLVQPLNGASGALAVRGGGIGGWGLYVRDARPVFVYKLSDRAGDVTRVEGPVLSAGERRVGFSIVPDGRGAQVILRVDGDQVATGHIQQTGFEIGDLYVGRSGPSPITEDLPAPDVYSGQLQEVTLELRR